MADDDDSLLAAMINQWQTRPNYNRSISQKFSERGEDDQDEKSNQEEDNSSSESLDMSSSDDEVYYSALEDDSNDHNLTDSKEMGVSEKGRMFETEDFSLVAGPNAIPGANVQGAEDFDYFCVDFDRRGHVKARQRVMRRNGFRHEEYRGENLHHRRDCPPDESTRA